MTKKYKARIGGCCAVATMLFVAISAHPAQAQTMVGGGAPVFDMANVTNSFLGDTISKIQRAFGAAVPVGAAGLQSQIATNNADNQNANAKQNLNISHDMGLLKHNTPSTYSACNVAAAAAAQKGASDGEAAMKQSMIKGDGYGIAGPAAATKAVQANNQAGTCPAQGDIMYQFAQNIGCTNSSNAGADNIAAVCSAEALQMPSSYQPSNTYSPVTGSDPWSLAMKYCQSLLPHITPPPSVGANANASTFMEVQEPARQSRAGYEACVAQLDKRSIPNSNYQQASDGFKKKCDAEAKAFHNGTTDCSNLSALVLERNAACITSFGVWHESGTVAMTPGEKVANDYAGAQSCASFKSKKENECEQAIKDGIKAADAAKERLGAMGWGNLGNFKIQQGQLEEEMKKQTAMLNDTLQKLTNQMQQLQAAIKSPDSKVPVSYTHKISTQVEN